MAERLARGVKVVGNGKLTSHQLIREPNLDGGFFVLNLHSAIAGLNIQHCRTRPIRACVTRPLTNIATPFRQVRPLEYKSHFDFKFGRETAIIRKRD